MAAICLGLNVLRVGGTASVWLGSHDNFFYGLSELNGIQIGLPHWDINLRQNIRMQRISNRI